MAFHTVLEILNAFRPVLSADVCWRVLVAAIAAVFAVVLSSVAGGTGNIVVPIKNKELVVLESGGLPGLGCVALPAIATDLAMLGVGRRRVARFAACQRSCR